MSLRDKVILRKFQKIFEGTTGIFGRNSEKLGENCRKILQEYTKVDSELLSLCILWAHNAQKKGGYSVAQKLSNEPKTKIIHKAEFTILGGGCDQWRNLIFAAPGKMKTCPHFVKGDLNKLSRPPKK